MEDEEIEKAITRLSEVHAMLVEGIDRGLIMMPRLQNFCLAHASEQPFYHFLTDIEETSARALQGYAFGSKNLNEFVAGIRDRAHFRDHHISPDGLQGMSFDEKLRHMADSLFSRMARIYSLQIKAIRERGRPAQDVAGLLRTNGLHILDIPLYFHLEHGTIAEFFQGKVLEPHQRDIELAERVKNGPSNRDDATDKQDAIKIIKEIHERYNTIVEIKNASELAAFKRKYPGRQTLNGWIKEALPGREFKSGRPRKNQ